MGEQAPVPLPWSTPLLSAATIPPHSLPPALRRGRGHLGRGSWGRGHFGAAPPGAALAGPPLLLAAAPAPSRAQPSRRSPVSPRCRFQADHFRLPPLSFPAAARRCEGSVRGDGGRGVAARHGSGGVRGKRPRCNTHGFPSVMPK